MELTKEQAANILDPETSREALRPYIFDPARRLTVVEEACRVAAKALRCPVLPEPAGEPLTQADLDKMHFERVCIDYGADEEKRPFVEDGVVLYGRLYSIDTLDGAGFEELLLDAVSGETLDHPTGSYTVYRRPLG